jgi:transposase
MAFLRHEKKASGTYLRIVQSYREDGKCKHQTLYNLGKVEDYNPESLKKIGQTLYELAGGTGTELVKKQLQEIERLYYGFPVIIKKLLSIYGLDVFFNGIARNKNLAFSMLDSVILLISERLHDPVSKLSSFKNQKDYIGLQSLDLQHIYRTLNHLHDNQEKIKTLIYNKGRNLFNQKLDVVFYDVTTFYFDSDVEDGFRQKGFGKDGKIGNTIICFGLLIDQNKQPVGYEVYRGKKYEGHTFTDAISRLRDKYQIEKVICVADTGMMNSDNVTEVQNSDYEFILGERLKNISTDKQSEILDITKYQLLELEDQNTNEKIHINYFVTEYKGKRLISTYSAKRAAKDKHERDEKIAQAVEFIKNPAGLEKKSKVYFLKKKSKENYVLDMEKITRSERFDGFFCLATNNHDLTVAQILDAYKQLYKIEQSFRTFKTFLETRPMYHWTETRILGHLNLCYICFAMLNYLQQQLQQNKTPQSENQIRKNLINMQMSLISQNDHEYYLRSKTPEGSKQIMKTLSIRELPDLIPKEKINQYM